jgi:hypothetical protein
MGVEVGVGLREIGAEGLFLLVQATGNNPRSNSNDKAKLNR